MNGISQEKQGLLLRLKRLQGELAKAGIDGCLIERPVDLYYFTGLKLSAGKLLVHAQGTRLLVDGRYLQIAKERAPFPTHPDKQEELSAFCREHAVKSLGFDEKNTSYERYTRLQKGAPAELIFCAAILNSVRCVKDPLEIAKMRRSAELLWQGFTFIKGELKTGIAEREVAKRFEIFCLERGAEGLAFEPIIAFGANSAMPHHRSGKACLKEREIALIDIGVVLDSYCSDMTRVVFHGQEEPRLKQLYEITRRAQKSALSLCRPGSLFKELDEAVRAVFREEKVEELFVHSLGHGIGLETHEFPRIKYDGEDGNVVLAPGMVFTVEPGLYVPGLGGVRYEDTIVITEKGYENFYRD